MPIARRNVWRAVWRKGSSIRASPRRIAAASRAASRAASLPPTAFVLFLQNHDQIGNRAFGERLTALADPRALEAAIALQLLCSADPAALHGRGGREPNAVFVLHRSQCRTRRRRCARGGGASSSSFLAVFRSGAPRQASRSQRRRDIRTIEARSPDAATDVAAKSFIDSCSASAPRGDHVRASKARSAVNAARASAQLAVIARWRMGDDRAVDDRHAISAPMRLPWPAPKGVLLFASATGRAGSLPGRPARALSRPLRRLARGMSDAAIYAFWPAAPASTREWTRLCQQAASGRDRIARPHSCSARVCLARQPAIVADSRNCC